MRWLLIISFAALGLAACPRPEAARCNDGVRNGEESDVDCGGSVCSACNDDRACLTAADCVSGICRANVCGQPTAMCMGNECPQQVSCVRNAECPSRLCIDGACFVERCDPPFAKCGAACVNPLFDPANCGGCGIPCQPGESCNNGLCRAECPFGLFACGMPPNLRCIDVSNDVLHCGDCTTVCAPGQLCAGGSCQFDCDVGQVACSTGCARLNADVRNCGGCNVPCDGGQVCVQGQCAPSCSAPLLSCPGGGPCVDVRFDPLNCGGCGMACPPVQNARPLCIDMSCTRSRCNPGFEDCDRLPNTGCEANLLTDSMNCGMCGRICNGGPCVNGNCP